MTKKRLGIILGIIAVLIAGVVLMYNFGWRLWGFSACVSPEGYVTYCYEITEDYVKILFDKNGYHNNGRTLGYIAEEKDGVLRIGIKYLNGITALLFDKGERIETLTVPITSKPDKIILCGNGFEIDINDHVNEEAYESIKDLITIW
ncbi:MAG: hypothetical protein E7490_08330 [Ruminococcaceae bacterium]|nr:hypothetical protein [Oscillospiraceae bacterium]